MSQTEQATPKMTITLFPRGELAVHFGRTRTGVPIELAPGTTIAQMLRDLGVPEGEVWMIARNGSLAKVGETLEPGDSVEMFAPVAGG
ncbi:MAG: MoaD/ThiS family protein [Chloroflexota bacterium]